jgi:hypothetical protein
LRPLDGEPLQRGEARERREVAHLARPRTESQGDAPPTPMSIESPGASP